VEFIWGDFRIILGELFCSSLAIKMLLETGDELYTSFCEDVVTELDKTVEMAPSHVLKKKQGGIATDVKQKEGEK
jgi:hypothetical protein